MKNYLKILHLNEHSLTPYHQQLSDAFMQAIERKLIQEDDVLPSINDLSIALDVSRNIVTKAYNTLKQRGVVGSVHGKGHYISNVQIDRPKRVLLLFNKLSSQKKMIYDAFAKSLGESVYIDFFIYNSSLNLFKKILADRVEHFDKIVVAPHFLDTGEQPSEVLNKIPADKLILIGRRVSGLQADISAVYEDFQNDIFEALEGLLPQLQAYHGITIVFPKNSYLSADILMGFLNFCKRYGIYYEIIPSVKDDNIAKDMLYITLTDDDLLALISKSKDKGMVLKEDFGIISYNETPFKQFILNGITTISADFNFMGTKAAELVNGTHPTQIRTPFYTIVRPSL